MPLSLSMTADDASLLGRDRADEDAELLRLLRAGDTDRLFAEIVRRYQSRVFRLVVSVLGPGAGFEADDVCQEVFLQLHRKLHTFRSESRLSTWIYRIAYRKAVDLCRRARHRLPHVSTEVLAEVEDGAEEDGIGRVLAEERRLHLRQALASLKPQHRSAIYLHYWLGHSVQEIAELLRVAPGTVKSYLHRARARLVPLLSEEVVR